MKESIRQSRSTEVSTPYSLHDVLRELHEAPRHSPDVMLRAAIPELDIPPFKTEQIIAIGASTGGGEALEAVLPQLTSDVSGIVIVQHIAERVVDLFVRHLDKCCQIDVRKATNGEAVSRGVALIAPGGQHLLLRRCGRRYFVELRPGPLVSLHRPSIDVLFRSAAYAGCNATGLIMTGLGDDGVQGLKEMRECGASTVAQEESTCVAGSMPRAAIKQGAADKVLALSLLAQEIASRNTGSHRI